MNSHQRSALLHPLGLDFDSFLYAQVGDDNQGGLLSVLSALARLGVDPWEEAARLARLPVDVAIRALSALLAGLPSGSGKPLDTVETATRLVILLPRASPRTTPSAHLRQFESRIGITQKRWLMVLLCTVIVTLVGSQMLRQHRLAAETAPATGHSPH
ncbi:MAG TPA: hypothetical protein VN645_08395 [Steroidobacteraceae bacterium]|nr:hypothetical protein [Steroidobacteraceae bacterium]